MKPAGNATKRGEGEKMGGRILAPERHYRNSPFCPQGHDKAVVGVTRSLGCHECWLIGQRKGNKRRLAAKNVGRPPHRPDITALVERMEQIRLSLGLKMYEFADRLEIGRATYCRFVHDQAKPLPSTLEKLLPNLKMLADEVNAGIARQQEEKAQRRHEKFIQEGRWNPQYARKDYQRVTP